MTTGLLGLVALSACVSMYPDPMPVPEQLAAAPEWRVSARMGMRNPARLLFGPFSADTVQIRDIRQRGGILDAVAGKREYQQQYTFVLRDTLRTVRWMARCDSRERERGVAIGSVDIELGSGLSLECDLRPGADTASQWKLQVTGRNDGMPAGTLRRGEASFAISGKRAPGRAEEDGWPAGYHVTRDGILVLAVDRTPPGYVRMAPGLSPDDQALLAAASAALMLQARLITE
ncbi:MAG TPA: hypothetical protein VF665_06680 [Longimicrobium sp.]|uniref:hypothetical protein n=1 Tax=Longimicrobium sp. TaxID=2029185 RepID=UPI002ED8A228